MSSVKRNFFCVAVFVTIVFAMFAEDPSPSPDAAEFDVIIKGGTVFDGSGGEPKQADVAIRGDRIAGIGDFKTRRRKR